MIADAIPTDGLHWLASLGVGGVLAGVIFHFYRQDRKTSEDRYAALAQDFRTIVQDNTAAMVKLCQMIDRNGGRE
mgnify:FL=1